MYVLWLEFGLSSKGRGIDSVPMLRHGRTLKRRVLLGSNYVIHLWEGLPLMWSEALIKMVCYHLKSKPGPFPVSGSLSSSFLP